MTTTEIAEARHTYEDVADRINMSVHYVKRHAREWPHCKFGRTYRFSDEDVAAIIQMHKRVPQLSIRQQRQADPSRPIGHGSRRRSA